MTSVIIMCKIPIDVKTKEKDEMAEIVGTVKLWRQILCLLEKLNTLLMFLNINKQKLRRKKYERKN